MNVNVTETNEIGSFIAAVQRDRRIFFAQQRALSVMRAVILAAIVAALWAFLRPDALLEQVGLSALTFVWSLYFTFTKKRPPMRVKDLKIHLDIRFKDQSFDPYNDAYVLSPQLLSDLKTHQHRLAVETRHDLLRHATTLAPLLGMFVALWIFAPEGISSAFANAQRVISSLTEGATLTIKDGKFKQEDPSVVRLVRHSAPTIEVSEANLIEIAMSKPLSSGQSSIAVELRSTKSGQETLYQSFQLNLVSDNANEKSYAVAIRVPESVKLYIPELSSGALANIIVRTLPYPVVSLSPASHLVEPWPNDQPLKLNIKVDSENPLQLVRLVIVIGKKRNEELVSNIIATDIKTFTDDYDLILEPYMENDLADVEIYAEAIDRSHPQALVGRSESLAFKAASAYGRYQQALDTLRQLKTMINDASTNKQDALDAKMVEVINSAERQSESSPFFDGLDRANISAFAADISNAVSAQNHALAEEVGERLSQFLFEHETIDDRERDRDYFIALRSYSRLIEVAGENKAGDIAAIADRLQKFLSQREKRWKLRLDRIPAQFKPALATSILADHPFHKDLQRVVQLMTSGDTLKQKDSQARGDSLSQLSKSSGAYRNWIETLEKAEDQARSAEDTKRQQNLAAARDELKELQQQQSIISQELDRAATRSKDDLHENWSATRMKQNSNIEATKRVEGQLRTMAPRAAERIALAKESMELTVNAGGKDEFSEAESASDLAGRLLRQADSAAQRAQQNGGQRGRRRRVTGDQYYGNSLNGTGVGDGGDIAIQGQYEVDKKYRDLIIDDIQQTLYEDRLQDTNEDRQMVEQYLRQVVR